MASILQFWTDEASIADGEFFRGQTWPISALAEYVMNTINPGLETGYKVTWDHIISRMHWMKKHLFNATSEEERQIQHQPIPVAGISSDLEVAMEKCYNEEVMNALAKKSKAPKKKPGTSHSPASKSPRLKTLGRGESIKLHIKKAIQGPGWNHVQLKDTGPDVG